MRGRRPIGVQRRGPGLMGTMARTAMIAGTATAASRAVSGGMQDAAQQKQQAAAAEQQAAFQAQADMRQTQADMAALQAQQAQMGRQVAPTSPQPAAATGAGSDLMGQLQRLAQLKQAGMLTDEEFAAAKAKLLGG